MVGQLKRIVFFTGRGSTGGRLCRGIEIAEAGGWPCNPDPASVTKEDLVIMVKCIEPEAVKRAGRVYCDIIDGKMNLHRHIADRLNVGVIVQTSYNIEPAKARWFPNNEVIWLPHTHCNNERRQRRLGKPVKRIGYTGTTNGFLPGPWAEFTAMAEREGFEVVHNGNTILDPDFKGDRREECCRFYGGLDIAVAYRTSFWNVGNGPAMKGPTKLNNAGSFRIPTVAFPEWAFIYNLWEPGNFVPVMNLYEMVQACCRLRDEPKYYSRIASAAWRDAQAAHIDEVVQRYRELLDGS